jgi:hypothetical protein
MSDTPEQQEQWRCRVCKEFKDPSEFEGEPSHLGVKCKACAAKQREESNVKQREWQRAYRERERKKFECDDPTMRKCMRCGEELKVFMFEHTARGVSKYCTPCRIARKAEKEEEKKRKQHEEWEKEQAKEAEFERLRAERAEKAEQERVEAERAEKA